MDLVNIGKVASLDSSDCYRLPQPYPLLDILLPSRTYATFARLRRVLQRMFELCSSTNSDGFSIYPSPMSNLWSLCFHNSEYLGDFHLSLLGTLQRCRKICSLFFVSDRVVEEDASLGHIVGSLPSSVRFMSFKSTLSKESIQALCIMLRSHNAAFLPQFVEPSPCRSPRMESLEGAEENMTHSTPLRNSSSQTNLRCSGKYSSSSPWSSKK